MEEDLRSKRKSGSVDRSILVYSTDDITIKKAKTDEEESTIRNITEPMDTKKAYHYNKFFTRIVGDLTILNSFFEIISNTISNGSF
jgi:hypothetical protein